VHPTTEHILRLLLSGETLSGEDMARPLSLSRAAVWKHIAELRASGFNVLALPGKGYKLGNSPDTLHQALVHLYYQPRILGRRIIFVKECGSTNAELKNLSDAANPDLEGLVIAADLQTAGRGRRGRSWEAKPGEALLFSLLLHPPFPPSQLHGITLLAGVAVAEALARYGAHASLKWPNDVYLNGGKLCGILAETNAELEHTNFVVLGIGLNVSGHPKGIGQNVTDLAREGITLKRAELLAGILARLEENYNLFLCGHLETIHEKWRNLTHTLGRQVTAQTLQGEFTGLAKDISPNGSLIIVLESGEEQVITAGDVTVR